MYIRSLTVLLGLAVATAAHAVDLDDCINAKVRETARQHRFETVGGCNTSEVTGVDLSCEATVCLSVPTGYVLAGNVTVDSSGARGSEHDVSPVSYTRNAAGQAERACVTLHAASVRHKGDADRLQRIVLKGDIERVVTAAMMREIATACARGAK